MFPSPLPRPCTPAARSPLVFFRPAAPPQPPPPPPAKMPPSTLGPIPQGVDKGGRPVLYQGSRMVCNNFNDLGCNISSCRFLHSCSFCGGTHARSSCPPPHFLIHGFTFGFHPGIEVIPESSYTCSSLQSALAEPDIIISNLSKELNNGFMIGPFTSPPFHIYRISPISIATRKDSP